MYGRTDTEVDRASERGDERSYKYETRSYEELSLYASNFQKILIDLYH